MQLETIIGPAIGALGAITAAWITVRAGRRESRASAEPDEDQPRPGAFAFERLRRSVARFGEAIWRLMTRLPPLRRRAKPWLATLLGFCLSGFGVAVYFRTAVDAVAGLVLLLPLLLITSGVDGETQEATDGTTLPPWAFVFLTISAVYALLRALTSNRRFEAIVIGGEKSADERMVLLDREVRLLEAEGWQMEERGAFQAVVTRTQRPNHVLHLVLTVITFGMWGPVWLVVAMVGGEKRKIASVDDWGNVSVRSAHRA